MIHPTFDEHGRALFSNYHPDGSWKVGQILRIGKIINHKGEEVESLTLEPQGIAHIISDKSVTLPDDVCALAHVLTRVCNEGLLTLNIGVVDPGWNNHLSTPILNFSSERRLLQAGQDFLRITFHEVRVRPGARSDLDKRIGNTSAEHYCSDIRARAVGSFGKNFLNIRRLVGKASRKESARFKEAMFKYVPIGAFGVAFFALLVTIGIATSVRIFGGIGIEREYAERLTELEKKLALVSAKETDDAQNSASTNVSPEEEVQP